MADAVEDQAPAPTSGIYYAASTGGFYMDVIHGANRPDDCVEITAVYHRELLDTSTQGKVIKADAKGMPVAVNFKPSDEEMVAHIKRCATAELKFSDGVAIRCLKAGVPYPASWQSRDRALRSIVGSAVVKPDTALPPRPEYPAWYVIDWLKVAVIAVRILSIIVAILFVLALCGCAEFNQVDPTGDIPIIDISVPLPVTFPI